jgi:hypothetical protein
VSEALANGADVEHEDEWEESGEDLDPRYRLLVEQISEECRSIGLYLENVMITAHPAEADVLHPSRLLVTARLTIGDIAWMERTQDPAAAQMTKEFRSLADSASDGLGDDLAERWAKRLRGDDPR